MVLDPAKTKKRTYVALKIWAMGFVVFLAYLMTVMDLGIIQVDKFLSNFLFIDSIGIRIQRQDRWMLLWSGTCSRDKLVDLSNARWSLCNNSKYGLVSFILWNFLGSFVLTGLIYLCSAHQIFPNFQSQHRHRMLLLLSRRALFDTKLLSLPLWLWQCT